MMILQCNRPDKHLAQGTLYCTSKKSLISLQLYWFGCPFVVVNALCDKWGWARRIRADKPCIDILTPDLNHNHTVEMPTNIYLCNNRLLCSNCRAYVAKIQTRNCPLFSEHHNNMRTGDERSPIVAAQAGHAIIWKVQKSPRGDDFEKNVG